MKGMGLWRGKENSFLCFHVPSFERYIWTMFLSPSLSTAVVVPCLNQTEFFLKGHISLHYGDVSGERAIPSLLCMRSSAG